MKKMYLRAVCMAFMLCMGMSANAQWKDALKSVLGNATKTETTQESSAQTTQVLGTVSSLLQNIIGSDEVKQSSLTGTWTYESPAVAFESSNMLKEAGGTVVAGTLEKKAQTYLSKVGFTPGKVTLTFDNENNFSMTIGNRTIKGTYTIEGSQITLSREGLLNYPVTANAAVALKELQITFKADKFLDFFTRIASMTSNATITSIAKIADGYDGMQLGFQFAKE